MLRRVWALVVLTLGFAACASVEPENGFIFFGQVLNGPGCIRLLANHHQYELIGLPAGFVPDTTQMRVVARYSTQYVSACMVGPILNVISIGPAR